jgi:enoyl-CoA hydratase
LTPPPQLSTTTPVWGAVVLTGGVPKRYITHFDIAETLAAASRVGQRISGQPLLNLLRGVDVVGAVPGGEQALERTPISQFLSVPRFNQVVLRAMRSPAVYNAAIGGPCGGAGLEMSVCFDVRLAADDDAVGFILPELLIGLTTTVGGQPLVQLIGPARALEMMLEGRMYFLLPPLQIPINLTIDLLAHRSTRIARLQDRYARWRRNTWFRNEMGDRDAHFKAAETFRR